MRAANSVCSLPPVFNGERGGLRLMAKAMSIGAARARRPAWAPKAASPSHQGAAGAPGNDSRCVQRRGPHRGRHGGDDRLLVENSAGTISMGDPYDTPRPRNVVTPGSKTHPAAGSATAQPTDSVTCNATPSAQVVPS